MVDLDIIYQLLLSLLLGGLIGIEREAKERAAGLQTYSLVSLGSCLFTIIAADMVSFFAGGYGMGFDPIRVIHAVVIGIGFVGGGVIFQKSSSEVVGLTTAAGLWVAAAVGITVGIRRYPLAIFSTFLALVILVFFGWIEEKVFKGD